MKKSVKYGLYFVVGLVVGRIFAIGLQMKEEQELTI